MSRWSQRVTLLVIGALIGWSLALGTGAGISQAATVCVNAGGTGGCYSSIQAAVTAANPGDTVSVPAGTYNENVLIDKAITLQGAGAATTIINAVTSNPKEGVIVRNVTSGQATVTGFTIQNAALSGLAVFDSSNVTISNNVVQNNDKNLQFDPSTGAGSCKGAAAFDQDDCGEGLHLRGVTSSTIEKNVVQGNAGGILLTDESGADSGNIIRGNTVRDNILDCGITLASHPASIGPPSTPGGPPTFTPGHTIFQNQVMDNVVDHNGAAGIGLFASVPGTATLNNLVQGNTITNNGLPGVTMHSHAPGQNLNGNKIINNTISGNAMGSSILGAGAGDPDAGDTATTGILIYSAVIPVADTVITGNRLTDQTIGIWLTNTVRTVMGGNKISAPIPLVLGGQPQQFGEGPTATYNVGVVAPGSSSASASFTVQFPSTRAGRAEVLFGSGPGCTGLVQVATQDQGAGSTFHTVTVTGNDLPGSIGNVGIVPGATYWYELVTMTASGTEIDNNGGKCYSVTIPSASTRM